ncbi:MAG: glycerophosphodiester phosphodiesterase [Acidobacteria bacterium]|jgi:glycerophosphoryl diester phosphodiesterase|nr:glycerophosphodiester phosphodiesterase [Acidobacteriota bacterium]
MRVRPLVIGHRGFAARFPENTTAAVREAVAAGADGVETDVRLSRDGIWVCHHNFRSDRLPISAQRWRELRGRGISSLEEVLTVLPQDRWLFLEVKPLAGLELARGAGELVRLVAGRSVNTLLLSSSTVVLVRTAEILPQVRRSWVLREVPPAVPHPDWALSPRHRIVEQLLPFGRPLHPWTVNRRGRITTLAALGVASITSDNPESTLEILRGRSA